MTSPVTLWLLSSGPSSGRTSPSASRSYFERQQGAARPADECLASEVGVSRVSRVSPSGRRLDEAAPGLADAKDALGDEVASVAAKPSGQLDDDEVDVAGAESAGSKRSLTSPKGKLSRYTVKKRIELVHPFVLSV